MTKPNRKKPKDAATEPAHAESTTIRFASDEAAELAFTSLGPMDFDGRVPSSAEGFTVGDVSGIVAGRAAREPEPGTASDRFRPGTSVQVTDAAGMTHEAEIVRLVTAVQDLPAIIELRDGKQTQLLARFSATGDPFTWRSGT